MSQATVHRFQAEVSQVLHLVINSLYSHKEVFLRELVSNASDALDKLRFRSIREPELLEAGEVLGIRIIPDKAAGTLTIADNGVGMTAEELTQNLGTVAWSGSRAFLDQLAKAQAEGQTAPQLIGQFGVGFYSAYLVADQVEVLSRAAGQTQAHRWRSAGKDDFTVEPAERDGRGTSIVLHLKPEHREFLETWRLRELVTRYSDYMGHPIELGTEKDGQLTFETINRASALWQRAPSEVTAEQYEEFYKHLTHALDAPLGHRHFKIEGTQLFAGLLFVPRTAPFNWLESETKHGIRLHVRRVFVMENCEELVPRWLRFVRGVIDSEDLPLNVSREMLQDSRAVRIIKKQVTSQTLDLLTEIAKDKPEEYATFWSHFGATLKEGLHFEPEYKGRLGELVRFHSTAGSALVSLAEYVDRAPEGQTAIYYAEGTSRAALESSPHLESLRKKGYEVLLLTDPVDPFAIEGLGEYRGKSFVSAMNADVELPADANGADEAARQESASLLERAKTVLAEQVSDVRVSTRLTDSPACLVVPEGGLAPHIERLLRARQGDLPMRKRILEVNVEHPVVQSLRALHAQDASSPRVAEFLEVLYDQALLAEGSPIPDAARFAKRIAELLTLAAAGEAGQSAPR